MISLYKQDGEILYGIKEFLLDSAEDLKNLPKNLRSGSSALIIPTGQVYFLNGAKEWVAVGDAEVTPENPSAPSNCDCESILNQLDSDKDGVVDRAEQADTFMMYDL